MTERDFTELSRRADPDRPDVWRIFCGDINAGWIGRVTTVSAKSEWVYSAGFHPGSSPGEIKTGIATSFDEAKAKFLIAWLKFAHSRKPDDFEEWRDHRDFTAWKYRMHDVGLKMPTQSETGRTKCFCGTEITTSSLMDHIRTAHREAKHEDD